MAIALPVAAAGHGPLLQVAAAVAGAVLLAVGWLRVRRLWLYEWIVLGARYRARPHTLPAGAGAADLLRLLRPTTTIEEDGVIADSDGFTAVLDLGDLAVLPHSAAMLPTPASLLPPESPDQPPTQIQLLLTSTVAPIARIGGEPAANSYRQLSDGRHPAHQRAVLALRVQRADGWSEAELRRSLTALFRRTARSLAPLAAHRADARAALALVAELAHHDGAPIHEAWDCSVVGGLRQASFHVHHRSAPREDLVPRILALPSAATTVSIGAGPGSGAELNVRLASDSSAHLEAAVHALRRLAADNDATVHRRDGDHLPALAATLPLAVTATTRPGERHITAAHRRADEPISQLTAGLLIGRFRDGEPAVIRLFRPAPTRAVVVGGTASARLLVFRAIAVGAHVVVRTDRPRLWEPLAASSTMLTRAAAQPTPLRPRLVVDDTADRRTRPPEAAWETTLLVRDRATPADVEALASADLVLLQAMDAEPAALVGAALGLGTDAEWLTRIGDDLVGLTAGGGLHWVRLTPTARERELVHSLNS